MPAIDRLEASKNDPVNGKEREGLWKTCACVRACVVGIITKNPSS